MANEHQQLLDRAYHWEKTRTDEVYLTQPMGGDVVRDYTWGEVMDESRRIATYLESFDFPPGSRIAILSKNCAHFIMSDLAIWMAGHTSVALYPTLQPEMVRYILDHSDAKLLFVGKLDGWREMQPGVPESMPCVSFPLSPENDFPTWDALIKEHPPLEGEPVPDPKSPALFIYTSGSTGTPKGVAHSFDSIVLACDGFKSILDIKPEDRLLSYLPLAHVFERAAIEAGSLYYGCHVFFAESLETFVKDVNRARPTVFQSVPRLWLKFQQGVFEKMPEERLSLLLKIPIVSGLIRKKLLNGLGLDQTRVALSGSAPIPPELIDWYRGLGLELLEGYAMSENFAYSHLSVPGRARVGYVGHALPGVEHRIDENGEIHVKSPADMIHYYNEPEKTAESFTEDGFLKTGDRGEIDEDGRLRITGRVKELFKTSKGKYVAPAPIENLLLANGLIEACCVSGLGRPQPHAVVMLNEALRGSLASGSAKDEVHEKLAALVKDVNAQLDPHEKLGFVAVTGDEWQIENGFLTPTMKIKRDVIEEAYAGQLDDWYEARVEVVWHG